MKSRIKLLLGVAVLAVLLAGCGADHKEATQVEVEKKETAVSTESKTETVVESKQNETEAGLQTISYLGADYELPAEINTIVAASLEAMEDAAVLGLNVAGVISNDGTTVPTYLEEHFKDSVVVGTKREPSAEAMLVLQPDIILGTSKWDEAQMANYNKVATTIPYSHISTNWKDNLTLLGQVSGKEAVVKQVIAKYETDLKQLQDKVQSTDLKDKTALIIRVRGGLAVYPEKVYFNPSLYAEFGLKAPEQLATIEAQTEITYETLAEWNPDIILLQYSAEEGADNVKIVEEILANPIFQSTNAAKNGQVYENIVDPMGQGGTAWSKINFLEAFIEKVAK